MKYFWGVIALLFLPEARAQSLTVPEVRVSVKAESAALAREQALNQAYSRAFQKLMQEHFPEQVVAQPSQDILMNMVNDFSIDREKTTPTSYAASLTFQFDEPQVRAWFQQAQPTQHARSPSTSSYGFGKPLKMKASYDTHKEWLHLKKMLEECPGVQNLSVFSLSLKNATLEVHYTGPIAQLENSLLQKDILCSQQGDHWLITLNK